MLIVTVACGFGTGVALFSCKCRGQGGQILSEVAVGKLPCRPVEAEFVVLSEFCL